jgi:hypothetical protein
MQLWSARRSIWGVFGVDDSIVSIACIGASPLVNATDQASSVPSTSCAPTRLRALRCSPDTGA